MVFITQSSFGLHTLEPDQLHSYTDKTSTPKLVTNVIYTDKTLTLKLVTNVMLHVVVL